MIHQPYRFEGQVTRAVQMNYLLYLPASYEDDAETRWPMIVYLHGAGERGDDPELVKRSGIAFNLSSGKDLPFIVLSPQCPPESHWTLHTDALNALLSEVIANYRVDESRVYMTGMSLGGAGTWFMAGFYPERFAAIAPLAARIVPLPLNRLVDMPIWVFHGEQDDAIPMDEAARTVEALKSMGGNVKMTVYPDLGHDIWRQTYSNPELYDWFLSHQRK